MEIFIREIVGKWFLDFLIIRLVIFVFNGIEVGMKGNERRRKKDRGEFGGKFLRERSL